MPATLLRCALAFLLLPALVQAQSPSPPFTLSDLVSAPAMSSSAFSIDIDTIATNIGPLLDADLTGFSTYRLYVTTEHPDDQVSAIYGGNPDTTILHTTGTLFQDATLGGVTAEGVIPAVWGVFPSNEFDSWVTIGIDLPAESTLGQGTVSILESSNQQWTNAFEGGSGFAISDTVGGGWYVLPSTNNGIAGADQRVLIAQITTDGDLSGVLHAQIFLQGDNLNGAVYLELPLLTPGCTDPFACNYVSTASEDDGSCTYAEDGLDCDGNCLSDVDGDGVCDEDEIGGCTDPEAVNYNPDATEQTALCLFDGCTNPIAINYDPDADLDDGSCILEGCTDFGTPACNYDPTANQDDGSCNYDCYGCINPTACNYDPDATVDDGSCDFTDCVGCTDPAAINYDDTAVGDDGTCLYGGCTDMAATNFDGTADVDDGSCLYGGCTDPTAANFDATADVDDGTCLYGGCTYPNACNYQEEADLDDGSCLFAPDGFDCDGQCLFDADDDGICDEVDDCVGTPDAIGVCNGDCQLDADGDGVCDTNEIEGCTYADACNYDPLADDDDGSCTFPAPGLDCEGNCLVDADGDGICDENDDCVGELDACGFCNGPGAILDCGCSALPEGDCDCDGNQLDALGICGGNCTSDLDGDGICDDLDDCVGALDECGICNGPGETEDCGCEGIPAGDCDCNGNQLDALGICGGDCSSDLDGDGICDTDEVPGCTDSAACNYNGDATDDDGSCVYAVPDYDCEGICLNDADGDGVCDTQEIAGCTDEAACNFDALATDEDGSCIYPDPTLDCNGNCLEDDDGDGICNAGEIQGCVDSEACNFNPLATDDDGNCDYLTCAGCTNPEACNFDGDATFDDGSCSVAGPCQTCIDGAAVNTSDTDGDGVCDGDEIEGCTNPEADNFDPAATEDDGTCKIFGCTDTTADNYNPIATDDDASCEYLCVGTAGCTYPDAENFNPDALCENGTCTFDCGTPTGSCVLDYDGNGLIGSADLVYFLGWFDLPCEE